MLHARRPQTQVSLVPPTYIFDDVLSWLTIEVYPDFLPNGNNGSGVRTEAYKFNVGGVRKYTDGGLLANDSRRDVFHWNERWHLASEVIHKQVPGRGPNETCALEKAGLPTDSLNHWAPAISEHTDGLLSNRSVPPRFRGATYSSCPPKFTRS